MIKAEIQRYSRQLMLPEFEAQHQDKMKNSTVLVVGAGGLGSPALNYLVGAGVGRIDIAEFDTVSLSNLQRQVLYHTFDVGKPKTDVIIAKLQLLNPHGQVRSVGAFDAESDIAHYDVILDCSDNFETRYLIAEKCVQAGKTWVWGAAQSYEGMLSVFTPEKPLSYLFPASEANTENCDTVGILGMVVGVIGSMMALEAFKLLTGSGQPLYNTLLTFDALEGQFSHIRY